MTTEVLPIYHARHAEHDRAVNPNTPEILPPARAEPAGAEASEDVVTPPFRFGLELSVVMPVYNEVDTVSVTVERVLAQDSVSQLLLVDDGSTDGTAPILHNLAASDPRIRVLEHEANRGKGAALKTGFDHASGDVVLIQDADEEYDPADYPILLKPFVDSDADVVFGSRWLIGSRETSRHLGHYLGNRFLTAVSNVFTGLNLSDMETCYKAFRREALDGIQIRSRRFTVEPELTAKIARRRLKVVEVPISYRPRSWEEGKKIGWRDACAALWAIVRYRFGD